MTLMAGNPLEEIRSGNYASGHSAAAAELRVLDWNIDRGHNLPRLADGIKSQHPDIAILQEVDLNARRTDRKDVAAELARRLKLNYVFGPEFQELSQGSDNDPAYQGQAILTSLPVVRTRILRFSRQSQFWAPRPYLPTWAMFQRRVGGRIALVSELRFRDRPLVVYNLHLESRSAGEIQLAQLDEVLRDASHYPPDTPILVAGDFNTKYRKCTGEVLERMRKAGYQNAAGDNRPRTHVIVGALDWIFARGPIHLEGAQVHRDIPGSDHFVLSARITSSEHVVARSGKM